jgi:ABC-type spermidine/putrescine transport system permease subunit I
MTLRTLARRALLLVPIVFVAGFLLVPIALTFVVSFWERAGLRMLPAFTLDSYEAIISGARLIVLERSLVVAIEATLLSLLIAYPIAYFLARKASPPATRLVLMLFTVPFLINYIIRSFSWTYLLSRTGPINSALISVGAVDAPVDWLLYSDFAVFIGLISSYMPFMIFPLWLSISGIDQRLLEASVMLGAPPPTTFWRVTLPLSLPGVFAALIFGFVGSFGESAVPIIMGGVGYELMGNTIMSSMDVLNYPLAAALSSIVILSMLLLIVCWYLLFDLRTFLGKLLRWRAGA